MTQQQEHEAALKDILPSRRKIYFLGALIAFILIAYSLATILIVAFIGGPPTSALECFSLLRESRLHGLLRLDVLTVFMMPLYYILFYSIYLALKKNDNGLITISIILIFAGITLFLATPSVFSYLHLSDRYATTSNAVDRNNLLAAGEAILASDMWHGTGALIGGLLLQSGAILISIAMLKGNSFNKLTAWTGIATHGLDLAHILIAFFLPTVGIVLMSIAGVLYLLWFPLIGIRLLKLSRLPQE
jgi:hypothetical protein